jgi:hypothetical protein
MTKLLERFDVVCDQLRSLPDPAERERTLATFIRNETAALGTALDAMTAEELVELQREAEASDLTEFFRSLKA